MWLLTVLSVMYMSSAISRLVRPAATASRICSSRSVSRRDRLSGLGRGSGVGERGQQPRGHVRRDERVAGGGRTDRLSEQVGAGVLEQEAAGAGAQRAVDVLVEVERRDDDDRERVRGRPARRATGWPRCRPGRGMRMSNRQTSGRSRRASSTAARPSAASPDDLDPGLGVEDHREPGPHHLLVVGDEDPDAHRAAPRRGRTAATVHPRSGFGPASQVPPSSARPLRHADQSEPGGAGRTRVDRLAVVADPQAHSADRRRRPGTAIRVARRACRRALVTDSCARR